MDIDKRDESVTYYYDAVNQLVRTVIDGKTTTYTYDLAGNMLSDGTATYTYDTQNRLLSKTDAEGTTNYTYDNAGNLISESTPGGSVTYSYDAQNRLVLGARSDGQSSAYEYNALGVRTKNVQVRENVNAGYQNADLVDGSHGTDYLDYLSDDRATKQPAWETEVGTTVQNNFETVTKAYVVDYLSLAYRDILVTEDGGFTQRYVYDANGTRISAEYGYADGTERGTKNADGEYGENLRSDIAVNEVGKVWFRTSMLGSTLFVVDANGETVSHTIYDAWGEPLTETYIDANYSGLDNANNFTGYTYDEVLSLYYAQNRFYDAATHRFTQEDIVKDGGNWYVYCGNNPGVNVDPTGLYYIYEKKDENGNVSYEASKQSWVDALFQGAFDISLQAVFATVVAGSSVQDTLKEEIETLYAPQIEQAKQALASNPYGAAIVSAYEIIEKAVTLVVDIPAALEVSARDKIIWQVMSDAGLSTNSTSSKIITAFAAADGFVQNHRWIFTKYESLGNRTIYDAGKAIVNGNNSEKASITKSYNNYWGRYIKAQVLSEHSNFSVSFWLTYKNMPNISYATGKYIKVGKSYMPEFRCTDGLAPHVCTSTNVRKNMVN